jgi:hypothetical protein
MDEDGAYLSFMISYIREVRQYIAVIKDNPLSLFEILVANTINLNPPHIQRNISKVRTSHQKTVDQ